MFSIEQLTAIGAEVVAGRVMYNGENIEGVWAQKGFVPAEGSKLDGVKVPKAAEAKA